MSRQSGHGERFDRLVDEARQHYVPPTHGADHDWSELDRRLFVSVESPVRAFPRRTEHKVIVASGLVLAAAAALTLALRSPPSPSPSARQSAELAASVREGSGLRIFGPDGEVRPGSAIRVGDRLETTVADVGFVSLADTGAQAVAWRLEKSSQVLVSSARLPLGLTLDTGAVEADVARVASGEAFVVDVGHIRVAVRGTHLRVARAGTRATVDLTEGTIAIGPVPSAGLTEGTIVTAPAHVDIDLSKPHAVVVDRKEEMVRAPTLDLEVKAPPSAARPHPPVVAHASSPLPLLPEPPPAASVPAASSAATPQEVVADAVRSCVAKHVTATAVHVTVTTSLVIDVGEGGKVKLARFEPPLAPEVQTCAADIIYKTRFGAAGTERITIVAER